MVSSCFVWLNDSPHTNFLQYELEKNCKIFTQFFMAFIHINLVRHFFTIYGLGITPRAAAAEV
jgi:hypothetical protein